MATIDTTVRAKDGNQPPSANQLRSIIDRVASNVREDERGALTTTLRSMTEVFDKQVQATDKKLQAQQWSPAGRELVNNEAVAEATAMLKVQIDAATTHHRQHLAALDGELSQIDSINEFRAVEIRRLLREMPKSDRDHFISQSDDAEVLAAVVHGPQAFPIASDDAVK